MQEKAESASDEPVPVVERGAKRDSLLIQAVLRRAGQAEEFKLRVRNISAGGLMADAVATFMAGETVELMIRNIGHVAGRVAWQRRDRIGIAFDTPIDPQLARRPLSSGGDPGLLTIAGGRSRRPGLKVV